MCATSLLGASKRRSTMSGLFASRSLGGTLAAPESLSDFALGPPDEPKAVNP